MQWLETGRKKKGNELVRKLEKSRKLLLGENSWKEQTNRWKYYDLSSLIVIKNFFQPEIMFRLQLFRIIPFVNSCNTVSCICWVRRVIAGTLYCGASMFGVGRTPVSKATVRLFFLWWINRQPYCSTQPRTISSVDTRKGPNYLA